MLTFDGQRTRDLGIEEEVVTCKLYLWLAFIILTLERVTIGCCEVRRGGGGVVSGVDDVCGDGVDSGVKEVSRLSSKNWYGGFSWSHRAEGKDSFIQYDMTRKDNFIGVQVKASVSTMIVRVPEKDRWCGTRGKFMRWKGIRVTKASKHA
uniref:Uncharacterized protein n=1 Tax=Tanacetum cinerariifolium TaxID=118510 RepID=A0A699HPD7_TANCI|nr:hypothetical protein [Tanacetum cinerariifolium]